jgi:K+-sensing histidine kinase KdpD
VNDTPLDVDLRCGTGTLVTPPTQTSTDRETLRQRVQVPTRLLGHTIRDDLDITVSHAEFALGDGDDDENAEATEADESVARTLEAGDEITRSSADARRIERSTRDSSTDQSVVNLPQLVDEAVETVLGDRPDVSVAVEVPQVELPIARELLGFALRTLVDDAVEHDDAPSPRVEVGGTERGSGVRIVVSDNGPGVPDAERQVTEAGEEEVLDHATSLGPRGATWTVQKTGGEPPRRDGESGAAVVVDLPTRSPVGND